METTAPNAKQVTGMTIHRTGTEIQETQVNHTLKNGELYIIGIIFQ